METAATATAIPAELFTTSTGLVTVIIVGIILLVAIAFVFILIRNAIQNLRIKTQNLEITSQEQSRNIQDNKENAEQSLREILKRQQEFINNNVLSQENDLLRIIFEHNNHSLSEENKNAARLMLQFALTVTVGQILKYNYENHIPDDQRGIEEYAEIKTTCLYNSLKMFYSTHRHLLPTDIDIWGAFNDEDAGKSLKDYIYKNYVDMVVTTKKIRQQYLDNLAAKSNGNDQYSKTLELLK